MKLKLINAVSLHSVVSQLNVSCLKDNAEKLSLIRLAVALKHYAQQWDDTRQTAQNMAAKEATTLLNQEAASEVEIDDNLLVSIESAETLAVANSETLPAGALSYIIDYLTKD